MAGVDVSILARPHVTGAQITMAETIDEILFQSSPVRM